MSTELIVFGAVAILLGVGLLSAARRFYPRLELAEDALSTIRLLTALIAAVLLLTGVGLVLVGLFG
nr:hypothetical protein [Halosolutus amylolyticus]